MPRVLVLAVAPGSRTVGSGSPNWGEMATRSRQDRTEQRDRELELATRDEDGASVKGNGRADALRWLELAGGNLREAVAERLAQAHIRYQPAASTTARPEDRGPPPN